MMNPGARWFFVGFSIFLLAFFCLHDCAAPSWLDEPSSFPTSFALDKQQCCGFRNMGF